MRKNENPQRLSNLAMGMIQFLFLAGPVTAQIPCEYEVTTLQFPIDCGLGTVITTGLSLNENGAVVGYYRCPISQFFQGFLWTAEAGFEALDPPEGVVEVFPTDINDAGIICGSMYVWEVGYRGFVYDNGEWTILPPVVNVPGAWSGAAAINNAGTVVGQRSITEELTPQNAYIWSATEGFSDLEGLEGLSGANDIAGKIVTGWTAEPGEMKEGFLWEDGQATLLGPIPGGISSSGRGTNAIGQVCGFGVIEMKDSPTIVAGFVWNDGVFTLIDPIRGYDTSSSLDINDQGYATGTSVNLDQPTDRHGYVWIDGVTKDLNDLISGESTVVIGSTAAINERGEIVANGHDEAGEVVAFLLIPAAAPLGDLDGDCMIGAVDLYLLLTTWGRCADCDNCHADLDNNCVVGVPDLLILLGNWG